MRFITACEGQLREWSASPGSWSAPGTTTGLAALDELLPEGKLSNGAVHEILWPNDQPRPLTFAAILARAFCHSRVMAWCDPEGGLFPPALAGLGIDLNHLLIFRPQGPADLLWGLEECLRCGGVGATVGQVQRLSRLGARRFQLAAESGQGAGILLRGPSGWTDQYAAATRWKVSALPGSHAIQRWNIQLIHSSHGGRLGQSVVLEVCRETHHVRAVVAVAHRLPETPAAAAQSA